MKEIIITKNEDGYKLRKVLSNYLSSAPASFIYKMLRKKNIVLNDKKADSDVKVKTGDSIKLYLSDETIENFSKKSEGDLDHSSMYFDPDIIYEDDDFLFCFKPINMLSQKAKPEDYSINEIIIDYLKKNGSVTDESLRTFKPSVCNRLDRNTSGIIVAGKTSHGSRYLSEVIRDRSIKKFYIAVVAGKCDIEGESTAYLSKDPKNNKVMIKNSPEKGYLEIRTRTKKLCYNQEEDITLLKIELITGKSHQIRAHLSHMGYPIIGDIKYGDRSVNSRFKQKVGLNNQLLTAYEVVFPDGDETISGKTYCADIPDIYKKLFRSYVWQPGKTED